MKAIKRLGILVMFGIILSFNSCAGYYYINDRPAEEVYVRPAQPYPGAVWIEGDWVWVNGRYVHNHGHWDRVREGRRYIAGYWEHTNRGYRWRRGHWQ